MTSMQESEFPADGNRIIDFGTPLPEDLENEDDHSDANLVVLSLDPGETTGWSVLKVPTARLRRVGVARTLAHCRWQHGVVQRSAIGTGTMAQAVSDSRHVTHIFDLMADVWEKFVLTAEDVGEVVKSTPDEEGKGVDELVVPDGWQDDRFVLVMENFKLRMLSMDENLLAPVRIRERILDRLWMNQSPLPVFFQAPSDAKRTIDDSRLRSWGMYRSDSGPHARDADRHGVLFMRRFASERAVRGRLGYDW